MTGTVTWYVMRGVGYDEDSKDLYEQALDVWPGSFHTALWKAQKAAQDEVNEMHNDYILDDAVPEGDPPQLKWEVNIHGTEWTADCPEQQYVYRVTKLELPYRVAGTEE